MANFKYTTNMLLRAVIDTAKNTYSDWLYTINRIDSHDHTKGKGKQITTEGIEDGAISNHHIPAGVNIPASKINPNFGSNPLSTSDSVRFYDINSKYCEIVLPEDLEETYGITLPESVVGLSALLIDNNGIVTTTPIEAEPANVSLSNLNNTSIPSYSIEGNSKDLGEGNKRFKSITGVNDILTNTLQSTEGQVSFKSEVIGNGTNNSELYKAPIIRGVSSVEGQNNYFPLVLSNYISFNLSELTPVVGYPKRYSRGLDIPQGYVLEDLHVKVEGVTGSPNASCFISTAGSISFYLSSIINGLYSKKCLITNSEVPIISVGGCGLSFVLTINDSSVIEDYYAISCTVYYTARQRSFI